MSRMFPAPAATSAWPRPLPRCLASILPFQQRTSGNSSTWFDPGKYSYASPGAGTTSYLSGELFKFFFKLDLAHVPFNGTGPAISATVPGHTPILFAALAPQVPQIKAGNLRPWP